MVQHHNAAGVVQGRQTMGDHQCDAVFHQLVQGLLHIALGLGVERRSGLIQNQDGGILVERAGDGQTLALRA